MSDQIGVKMNLLKKKLYWAVCCSTVSYLALPFI